MEFIRSSVARTVSDLNSLRQAIDNEEDEVVREDKEQAMERLQGKLIRLKSGFKLEILKYLDEIKRFRNDASALFAETNNKIKY